MLKIESDSGVLLFTQNVTQEILPKSKHEIIRNINSIPIRRIPSKLRCLIETPDTPNMSALQGGDKFKIYSIIKLKYSKSDTPPFEYVPDSLEEFDDFVICRPVFNMLLVNFSCCYKNNNPFPSWKFEFEEI